MFLALRARTEKNLADATNQWMVFRLAMVLLCLTVALPAEPSLADENDDSAFASQIQPILADNCFDCHGNGMEEGSVVLDQFTSQEQALSRSRTVAARTQDATCRSYATARLCRTRRQR